MTAILSFDLTMSRTGKTRFDPSIASFLPLFTNQFGGKNACALLDRKSTLLRSQLERTGSCKNAGKYFNVPNERARTYDVITSISTAGNTLCQSFGRALTIHPLFCIRCISRPFSRRIQHFELGSVFSSGQYSLGLNLASALTASSLVSFAMPKSM